MIVQTTSIGAFTQGEAISAVADYLVADQQSNGGWPGEAIYTGSIAAGVAGAYEVTCNSAYKSSAELAGDYIVNAANGAYFGDELYALARLSEISDDPNNNQWRTEIIDFYEYAEMYGTEAFIAYYIPACAQGSPGTEVFYAAHHAVAAYYVDAQDKALWRQSVIDWLAQFDDSSSWYPVMGLGVATWALALTGDLDDTLVDPSGTGSAYWNMVRLSDLPNLLLSHQVSDGDPYAGSFYYRFDHQPDPASGYVSGFTEDTVFPTLGLVATFERYPDLNLDAAILVARQVLSAGVHPEGKVYQHLWETINPYYFFAGEMLSALTNTVIPGDLNLDGGVTFIDYALHAENQCAADIDNNGVVDSGDLATMFGNWLKGTSH